MRTPEQKKNHEIILASLTRCYMSFTDPRFARYPTTWAQRINSINYDNYYLDRCFTSPEDTITLMRIITNGIIGQDVVDYDHAQVACHMFQELYRYNPTIQKHINYVFEDNPRTIQQLMNGDSLSSLLRAQRVVEEVMGRTPPLVDNPRAVRLHRPVLDTNVRATDLESIHQFNAENRRDEVEHFTPSGPR